MNIENTLNNAVRILNKSKIKNSILDLSKKYKLIVYHQVSSLDFSDLEFFYKENNIQNKLQNQIPQKSNILSQKSQQITFQNNEILTNTENIILNNLKNAELTATQIQEIIKKSREHTSRILKKLFNNKLIIRNNTRPYTYKINN